ncbi:formate/nitrite transporter family protein [Phenylobacterium sp.]|jgi:formate/nitrite transporter FocA (FNT family)|uniref:formate/nitrite transporter family protein n=1 Tax=Phenylobacterium sp. TaxID=1871053 RepID=UPI002E369F7D|nr:formate/nitrite transporter family protein [Phenylobacterium sp.]HEX4712731.1 formate/nitrite transporter family protein [Phenylobacterium sp.]
MAAQIRRRGAKALSGGEGPEPPREAGAGGQGFSAQDTRDIEERRHLRAPMIYEVLRREGEEEMSRPISSLWWSGVAAGLSISFSLLSQAILQDHLPDRSWRPLVSNFGYPVGFLISVLGRQQLFTENTITVVLPVAASPTLHNLRRLIRMWAVVLSANMAGTLFAALFCCLTPVLHPDIRAVMLEISRHAMEGGALDLFFRAITAGFLIAAMVWLLPSAGSAEFLVITMMTYLIGVGGFAHVIAGSFEAFMLVVSGQIDGWRIAFISVPVLLGNIVGGTVLFTLISHAQVAPEM